MAATNLFSRKSRSNLALALGRGNWRDALIPCQLCFLGLNSAVLQSLSFALFVMVHSKPQELLENSGVNVGEVQISQVGPYGISVADGCQGYPALMPIVFCDTILVLAPGGFGYA